MRSLMAILAMTIMITACEEDQGASLNTLDEQELVDTRTAKDDFLKNSEDSPIPVEMR